MERDPSEAHELRRCWRKNWLRDLFEFSSRELQQQSWITGSRRMGVRSYDECMCTCSMAWPSTMDMNRFSPTASLEKRRP